MELKFPEVTKTIHLSDYAEEFGEVAIRVHVNVPRATIDAIRDFKALTDAELFAWLGGLWSAVPDTETTWTTEDIEALWTHCRDNDPALWAWLVGETVRNLIEYRTGIKKV